MTRNLLGIRILVKRRAYCSGAPGTAYCQSYLLVGFGVAFLDFSYLPVHLLSEGPPSPKASDGRGKRVLFGGHVLHFEILDIPLLL